MKIAVSSTLFFSTLLLSQFSTASVPVPLGLDPQGLPFEIGGMAGVAALSLIIATQLIKRRK